VKQKIDMLLEKAVVLTMDADRRLIFDGAIAINGKNIVDVGTTLELNKKYVTQMKINGRQTYNH